MAHHQGMTIVAIADALLGGEMRRRFHREPIIAAVELLLQERHPREATAIQVRAEEVKAATEVRIVAPQTPRRTDTPHTAAPQIQILSNGRYSVMLTNAGSGYSRWNEFSVTRWREDRTLDDWGSYIYLRDTQANRIWSAAYQPTRVEPDAYAANFSEDRVEFVRRDRTIATTTEILVSAESDAEVRRVSLANMGGMRRDIEVTSYAEIVLGSGAADQAHPAFSKLFVQTEYVPQFDAILAHRRKRAPTDPDLWAAHFAVVDGVPVGQTQFETDRARFIGVGRDLAAPEALERPLSDTVGTVLDPVFSIRRTVRVSPGKTTRIAFWTLVGSSREEVLERLLDYNDPLAFERARTLAWTHAQIQLRHMDLMPDDAGLFQSLAETVLFSEPGLRPTDLPAAVQSALWAQGISGDLPILLVRIDDLADIGLARQLILAHEYFRLKRLAVDVVILNERASSYIQDLQEALLTAARASQNRTQVLQHGGPGRVFVLRGDLVSDETRSTLLGAARAVLIGRRGTLAEQLKRLATVRIATAQPVRARRPVGFGPAPDTSGLAFFNGYGGFDVAAREYVVVLRDGARTPAPWINVVANPDFGFHASADGAGYTWSRNSRENQITPWSNDPVANRSGEMIFISDTESGELWGPTAHVHQSPQGSYVARHGFGYSGFEHTAAGIESRLMQFVPGDDPVKVSVLTLRNTSSKERRLSVTTFCEWVLGPSRSAGIPFIRTELSAGTGALLARNAWNRDYGSRVAFLDLGGRQQSWTGDRSEFIGRVGRIDEPAALLDGRPLSGRVGASLDPCGAMQTVVTLAPGASTRIVILLGQAASQEEADRLVEHYRSVDPDVALEAAKERWRELLGAVQVETPDPALDLMLNGWLLYQAMACRIWARSGFYQASGAYGFRDQLQDSMAVLSDPAVHGPGAHPQGGVPSVRGGRCPALVASGHRPGRPDPHFRRHGVARLRHRRLCGDHRRHVDPRRAGAVHRRPAPRAGRARRVLPAPHRRADAAALRALRARHRAQPVDRRARASADGHRRLERRHEPGRRRRQRRERLARLVPVRDPRPPGAARRAARARRPRRPLARARRRNSRRRWSSTAGTAPGTGAPISTTAPRSAPRAAAPAGSTRSPSPGRCCRAPPSPAARRPRSPPPSASWCGRTTGSPSSSRRPSIPTRRSNRATSRAIRPGFARTAANTPTAPSGSPGPWPDRVTAARPCASSPCSTRSPILQRRPMPSTTRSSPTSSPPTSIPLPAMSGGAGGPGTPDRRGGCTAAGSRRFSASGSRATRSNWSHPFRPSGVGSGFDIGSARPPSRSR